MALPGFSLGNRGSGQQTGAPGQPKSFEDLMARVCKQAPQDCYFDDGRGNLIDWIKYFTPAPGKPFPAKDSDTLYAGLALQGQRPVGGLEIRTDEISCDLSAFGNDFVAIFMAAFSMAVAAKANKGMRNGGVKIQGNQTEKVILTVAAKLSGLNIKKPDKNADKIAANYLSGNAKLNNGKTVMDLWSDFVQGISNMPAPAPLGQQASPGGAPAQGRPQAQASPPQAAPAATPPPPPGTQPAQPAAAGSPPQPLSIAFNRTIPANVSSMLAAANIGEKTYRDFAQAVIQSGDARRNSWPAQKLKPLGLQTGQLTDLLKAMDVEGITTNHHGSRGREVNYDPSGNRVPAPP